MNAVLAAAHAATDAITLPPVPAVAFATVALVAIAVSVWRLRRAGRLTDVIAAASAVFALGILASALLAGVGLTAPTAVISPLVPSVMVSTINVLPAAPPTTGDLNGPQLPTE